jgi:hypothetical protein
LITAARAISWLSSVLDRPADRQKTMTRVPYRPNPSAADRMGGDPGIRVISKATPAEREAAKQRAIELEREEAAIIAAQRQAGIISSE